MTQHELRPTPDQPVFYGQNHFGTFRDPFRSLNLLDADIVGHRWVPRWWRNLRLKEWQRFGIIHHDVYVGCAVFDAKFMAVSFVFVFDRNTGHVIEHKRTAITRGAIHVPEQLWRGDGYFRSPGYHVHIQNRLNEHQHCLTVDIRGNRQRPSIQAEFVIHEDLDRIQPLIVVLPVNDYRRPMYTHKVTCPVEGRFQIGTEGWKQIDGTATIDVQKTYYPHNAFWNWATFAGQNQDGVPVAVNLTHHMIVDDENWNENCFWIAGKLNRIGAARFSFDSRDTKQPWRIRTTDDRVDLTFMPQGERAETINVAGIVKSEFRQPFGTYEGTLIDDQGFMHKVNNAFGLAEKHTLKA